MFRFLFLLIGLLPLHAENAEATQEIRVALATENPLHPTYLGEVKGANASFEPKYLQELGEVLRFDMAYNGATRLLQPCNEREERLSKVDVKDAFSPSFWRETGAAYVIRAEVSGQNLSVLLFSVLSGGLKRLSEVQLTGELSRDRRLIHKVADAVHLSFFNKEGVASTRLLYAVMMSKEGQDKARWPSEIWECDWDGANARQVTREGSYCVTPVALPPQANFPKDLFLYVSYKQGQPKIYLSSLRDGTGKRLVDLRGNQVLPAISPQRDKIAFICDAAGRPDLFLQPMDPKTGEVGKPQQLFAYPRSTQASPTFSPDGAKLAFVSDKDGRLRIYMLPTNFNSKRPDPLLLTKRNTENTCPSWAPDGMKLAYSAKTNGVRQIWIYDFPTKEERQLTFGPGNKENPVWAPDSVHLVFNSTDASVSELYLVNLNQPEAVRISKGPGKKHYPSWGFR